MFCVLCIYLGHNLFPLQKQYWHKLQMYCSNISDALSKKKKKKKKN